MCVCVSANICCLLAFRWEMVAVKYLCPCLTRIPPSLLYPPTPSTHNSNPHLTHTNDALQLQPTQLITRSSRPAHTHRYQESSTLAALQTENTHPHTANKPANKQMMRYVIISLERRQKIIPSSLCLSPIWSNEDVKPPIGYQSRAGIACIVSGAAAKPSSLLLTGVVAGSTQKTKTAAIWSYQFIGATSAALISAYWFVNEIEPGPFTAWCGRGRLQTPFVSLSSVLPLSPSSSSS